MAKLTLTDVTAVQNQTSLAAAINANNTAIEQALEKTLSRDGTAPNAMGHDLDMNSAKIINLPYASSDTEPLTLGQFHDVFDVAAAAELEAALEAVTLAVSEAEDARDVATTASTTATDAKDDAVAAAAAAAATVASIQVASQAEAEAGSNNTKFMTPLRVLQSIDANAPVGGGGGSSLYTKVLLVAAGQSNALGAYSGGPNPSNAKVHTWDPVAGAWVNGGQYTALPWTRTAPDGNGGNNCFVLGAAHYIQQATGADVYIVIDATGGTSIDAWVASGTSSTRYAALKTKVQNALASAALTGKGYLDLFLWSQGEEDYVDSFSTHLTNLQTLDTQLRAETWVDSINSRFFATGPSNLHNKYEVAPAIRYFCNKSNGRWRHISTRGLRTTFDVTGSGDGSHFLANDAYFGGYRIIGPAFLDDEFVGPEVEPSFAFGRNTQFSPGDVNCIVTFDNLVSWGSRSDGPMVTDNFTGDGSTTAFILQSKGSISRVTINGVATTAYTNTSTTITFTVAPANAAAIVVYYGVGVNGPAAQGAISWGFRCYGDGNYSLAGGYLTNTGPNCNYSLGWGREIDLQDPADYSGAFGYQQSLQNTYQFTSGRGHTLLDSGTSAIGTFSAYTTTQTDPAVLQIGVGSSSGARSNALTVRKSGVVEQKTMLVSALPTAGTIGRRAFVTDATVTTFNSTVAGGGSSKVPVFDNGTNWVIG